MVFGICVQNPGIGGIQSVLALRVHPFVATGRFGLELRDSLLGYTNDVFGEPQARLDFGLFWLPLGD